MFKNLMVLWLILSLADCKPRQPPQNSGIDALPQSRAILGPAKPWTALLIDPKRVNESIFERRRAAWETNIGKHVGYLAGCWHGAHHYLSMRRRQLGVRRSWSRVQSIQGFIRNPESSCDLQRFRNHQRLKIPSIPSRGDNRSLLKLDIGILDHVNKIGRIRFDQRGELLGG